ncbi:hypothetical protein IV38_GL000572 [Lactobacillus selangorensis]|uniref:Uncharacterized protein n=1 Tax=Lactobacillus selangorensis TaxID=81857 RepID=A0A0R2G975_9LACO|nr:hypothetical protein [Lactobacillus selangorensis]KRN29685.1 hypothetical protein IV38_GL000572 [Lactobacillus selangorensis]KRN33786.1 hypothetical protein IV40_GL000096 [Lactobacillus selangorensis]
MNFKQLMTLFKAHGYSGSLLIMMSLEAIVIDKQKINDWETRIQNYQPHASEMALESLQAELAKWMDSLYVDELDVLRQGNLEKFGSPAVKRSITLRGEKYNLADVDYLQQLTAKWRPLFAEFGIPVLDELPPVADQGAKKA